MNTLGNSPSTRQNTSRIDILAYSYLLHCYRLGYDSWLKAVFAINGHWHFLIWLVRHASGWIRPSPPFSFYFGVSLNHPKIYSRSRGIISEWCEFLVSGGVERGCHLQWCPSSADHRDDLDKWGKGETSPVRKDEAFWSMWGNFLFIFRIIYLVDFDQFFW